ncbi:nose resistant to fluoxetine protein 6-like [Pollicipes pollicipes]|uniref:nose resistant to fluoxetine protein 6-like n=1 Tax=Pollicipes pollicipes TaxID=41117 RepID=UPI001885A2D4|nr:nose resistant to fluoxetine protein 6-like [Pollicipes pollicipes]
MALRLRLLLLASALVGVGLAAPGDLLELRRELPDLSWARLAGLQKLAESSRHLPTTEEFLRQTGALELYEALPEQLRTEQALPADIANLLIALLVGPYITPMLAHGISPLCLNHSWAYATSILSNNSWALTMFDADGKLPDGVLGGNLNYVGNWDECLSVQASVDNVDELIPLKVSQFQGKHCRPQFHLPPKAAGNQDSRFGHHANEMARMVGLEPILPPLIQLSGQSTVMPPSASIGLCIPSSCSAEDLRLSLQQRMPSLQVDLLETDCHVEGETTKFSAADIVMLCIICVTGLLMAVGTFIDVIKDSANEPDANLSVPVDRMFRGKMPTTVQKVLLAFSVWTNGRKILDTSSSSDTLGCLHGMRFLSMTWVILGHQYIFGLFSVPWVNQFSAFNVLNSVAFAAVDNATVSVDSFFFLSGLLVAYVFMRNMEKTKGKFNIIMYYVHRYIRLTPVLAMTIGFVATLYVHLGDGPFWGKNTVFGNPYICSKYWWKNLAYINNVYESEKTCLGQTWYLANDMQMFVLSPIVLLPLYFYPTIGQIWLILLLGLNLFITGYVTDYNDLGPSGGDSSLRYFVPWCRYGVYLVGVYTGWFLHRRRGRRLHMTLPVALAGWLVAALTACLVVYGLYDYSTVPPLAVPSKTASIVYAALNRPAWGMCLAWVVIACVHGYGGFINTLLSWKFWIPLSRVTYCCYLVSIDIQIFFYATLKSVLYFDQTTAVYAFLATLTVSIAVATVFSLAFEAPMMALEKIIFANVGAVAPKPTVPPAPGQEPDGNGKQA